MPFISAFNPSAAAEAAGAPAVADISKLAPGEMIIVEWRGTPIYVVRHSEESLNEIDKNLDRLADPDSDTEVQPIYAKNKYRSRKPGISVLSAVCTHLGCVPLGDKGEYGGWFCPCHGSHYDTSGRIRKGPAPTNMEVPKYEFVNSNTIKIG